MALQTTYWHTAANSAEALMSENEIQALEYLRSIITNDSRAFLISPSEFSNHVLNFVTAPYRLSYPEALFDTNHPDLPFFSLSAHNLEHAYLYLNINRDIPLLKTNPGSWFNNHLFDSLPLIYSNEDVRIYNVTKVTFPLADSETAFVLPQYEFDDSYLYPLDILSQSRTNYTVTYEQDPQLSKYENVILGHDLKRHQNFSTLFLTNSSLNNWNIISGNWKISNEGLSGAGLSDFINSDQINKVILSPILSKSINTNISTTFKVNQIDNQVSSYVSLVYSWINPDNYRFAGINFYKNNIYAYFGKVLNGETYFQPEWPGSKLDIIAKPGDVYNLALQLNNDGTQELRVNNQIELIQSDINEVGDVGLSYGRTNSVSFLNFQTEQTDPEIDDKLVKKFIDFATNGGNLVIFNTNGFGSLANYLLDKSLSDLTKPTNLLLNDSNKNLLGIFSGSDVRSNETINSNSNVLSIKNSNKNLLGIFSGSDVRSNETINSNSNSSPNPTIFNSDSIQKFSMKIPGSNLSIPVTVKQQGLGLITYVNILPLISPENGALLQNMSFNDFDKFDILFSNFSKIDDHAKSITDIYNNMLASFRDIFGSGTYNIKTDSILFPENLKALQIEAMTSDNNSYSFDNIISIDLSDYKGIVLQGNDASIFINNGKGIYSDVYMGKNSHDDNSSLSLTFPNQNNEKNMMEIVTEGGSDVLENITSINLDSIAPIHVFIRQPEINIYGNVSIDKLVANLEYIKTGYIPGKTLNFFGNISMSIYLSDTYTVATGFQIDKDGDFLKPSIAYNYFTGMYPLYINLNSIYQVDAIKFLFLGTFLITLLLGLIRFFQKMKRF